ncbi:MAG: hypothetical protein K9L68_08630 [Spirochaetales bacterium]|nr:hypothetical protein [Spirochaetales bacterium]MCF7938650.1 hypothetical protein [Spirochaetales bacterium]
MIALLAIGNELLNSQVKDENISFMIRAFSEAGFVIGEARFIRDEPQEITRVIGELSSRYEYVFSTGGVGPTHDDVTMEAVADSFGVDLEVNQDYLRFITKIYGCQVNDSVTQMAMIPAGSKVIVESGIHWPIIQIENCFILPGLPEAVLDKIPRIIRLLPKKNREVTATLYITVDESFFASHLSELQLRHPEVDIGSYPFLRSDSYRTRVTIKSRKPEAVRELLPCLEEYFRNQGWLAGVDFPE